MKNIIYILFFLVSIQLYAQVPEPVKAQSQPIAIMNATAHIGNGQVIQNSIITFDKGKITTVADATTAKINTTGYKIIDAKGKHVYPGLILPNTTLGLNDISSVRATRDDREVGVFKPHIRSVIAYNTDSEVIPTFRFNGILLAQITPTRGLITGSSSVMMLEGWNWEDALYKEDDGIHMNWPRKKFGPRWWLGETMGRDNPDYKKNVQSIEKFFEDAKSYLAVENTDEVNLRMEAMKGIINGNKTLYIHAYRRREIMASLQWAKSKNISKIVLVGADDAWYAKDFLKENNIPVILDDVHRLPLRDEEAVDHPYRLPSMLHKEGILLGLGYASEMANSRNLAFYAGTAAAYGLDKEETLKLVTSNTAKILGIDDRTGTLELGKDANIIISTGDIFDMRTNNVTDAFLQGKELNLDGKQQLLYERFKKKYGK